VEHLLHYLDDCLMVGSANFDMCKQNLDTMPALCSKSSMPIKPSKVEGPSTLIPFLGIHLNTLTIEASITMDRKQALLEELQSLHDRIPRKCTKREPLSLIGKLSFACKVVPAGRIFLRRMTDLSTKVIRLHHRIRIIIYAHLDMQWWLDFLP